MKQSKVFCFVLAGILSAFSIEMLVPAKLYANQHDHYSLILKQAKQAYVTADYKAAESLYKKGVDKCTSRFYKDSQCQETSLLGLKNVYMATKRLDDAEKVWDELAKMEVEDRTFTTTEMNIAEGRADILMQRGELQQAENQYKALAQIYQTQFGFQSFKKEDILNKLNALYQKQGNSQLVKEIQQQLVEMKLQRRTCYKEEDLDFAPFIAQLQKRIRWNWYPPRSNQDVSVNSAFQMMQDGSINNLHLPSMSKNIEANQKAIRAIENAAPFPHPPQHFVGIMLIFNSSLTIN